MRKLAKLTAVALAVLCGPLAVLLMGQTQPGLFLPNTFCGGTSTSPVGTPTSALCIIRKIVGSDLPNPATGSLGGVAGFTPVTHEWINGIGADGTPTATQPSFADISGFVSLPRFNNSLGADVLLNNTASYFNGPSVSPGGTGVWFASGTVTLIDTGGSANFLCSLWDGTTTISSSEASSSTPNAVATIALSGYLSSPAGNLTIRCNDATRTTGKILFNITGTSKDSTLSAFRIQ